jgi:hypothetical protein
MQIERPSVRRQGEARREIQGFHGDVTPSKMAEVHLTLFNF